MQVIEVRDGGSLALGQRPKPVPGPHEVLIRVAAAGINRADLAQRAGRYPPPAGASDILGLEVAGEIVATGNGVRGRSVGDTVCALLTGGGYAEYCAVPEVQTLPMPAAFSWFEAAAVMEAVCTVWDAVWIRGKLAVGESLLVHGGGSGIGTTAIQIGKALDHPVMVTMRSHDKARRCVQLGATAACVYTETDFVAATRVQWPAGANVILDMVGGSYLARNLDALSEDGRLSLISTLGGATAELPIPLMMRKRLTVFGSTLRARSTEQKGAVVAAVHANVWRLLESRAVVPVIDSVVRKDEVELAHRAMEQGNHFGKIVIDFRAGG
jgi:NADPH2:quinone reductase